MVEGRRRPVASWSWESSLGAFILAGAAGMVLVAFGEKQQVRMGLCLQTVLIFLERAVQLLRAQQFGSMCGLRLRG